VPCQPLRIQDGPWTTKDPEPAKSSRKAGKDEEAAGPFPPSPEGCGFQSHSIPLHSLQGPNAGSENVQTAL